MYSLEQWYQFFSLTHLLSHWAPSSPVCDMSATPTSNMYHGTAMTTELNTNTSTWNSRWARRHRKSPTSAISGLMILLIREEATWHPGIRDSRNVRADCVIDHIGYQHIIYHCISLKGIKCYQLEICCANGNRYQILIEAGIKYNEKRDRERKRSTKWNRKKGKEGKKNFMQWWHSNWFANLVGI